VHEVTAADGNQADKSKVETRPLQEGETDDMEEIILASSFDDPHGKLWELLEAVKWKYDFVSNNCRHHCETVLQLLQENRFPVDEDASEWLKRLHTKDWLVAGSMAVGGLAVGGLVVGGLLWLLRTPEQTDSAQSRQQEKNDQDL
jgi:hypothetical protein